MTTLTTIAPPKRLVRHDVLAAKEVKHRPQEYPSCIVLAFDPNDYQRFVTWVAFTRDHGETWEACWGHYFGDLDRAMADFQERA